MIAKNLWEESISIFLTLLDRFIVYKERISSVQMINVTLQTGREIKILRFGV